MAIGTRRRTPSRPAALRQLPRLGQAVNAAAPTPARRDGRSASGSGGGSRPTPASSRDRERSRSLTRIIERAAAAILASSRTASSSARWCRNSEQVTTSKILRERLIEAVECE